MGANNKRPAREPDEPKDGPVRRADRAVPPGLPLLRLRQAAKFDQRRSLDDVRDCQARQDEWRAAVWHQQDGGSRRR